MPIKGLSDRGLAFPEIGHIRKGAPKGEKTIGRDLTYFRVEFDASDAAAQEAFLRAYPGGQPAKLNIVLPFMMIDQVWECWLEAYTAGRLVARSDGANFFYWVDTDTGDVKVRNGVDVATGALVPYTEKQVVGKDYRGKPVYCKPTGRLKLVLPELQRMAFMTFLTGSKHDIINISNQLRAIEALCLQMGKKGIGGVPLILCRRPVSISCPEINPQTYQLTGKRVRRDKWLVSIEADPEFVKRALVFTKQLALPGNGLALAQPIEPVDPSLYSDEDPDASEADEQEFEEQFEASGEPIEVKAKPGPRTAAEVKAWITSRVESVDLMIRKGQSFPVNEKKISLLATVLRNTLKDDTDRYTACRWLVGEASTKKMSVAQVQALLEWQGVQSFEDAPMPDIIQETIACLEAANLEAGQEKML